MYIEREQGILSIVLVGNSPHHLYGRLNEESFNIGDLNDLCEVEVVEIS